jgi:hypothetical protein
MDRNPLSPEAQKLLDLLRKREKLDDAPEFPWFGKPRHEKAYANYMEIWEHIQDHQAAALELCLSGEVGPGTIMSILHWGSSWLEREANRPRWSFANQLRANRDRLHPVINDNLDWLLKTHGW